MKGEHRCGAWPSAARPAFLVHKEKVPSHCSLWFELQSMGASLGGEQGAASTALVSSFPGAPRQAGLGQRC